MRQELINKRRAETLKDLTDSQNPENDESAQMSDESANQ
jgi:hypothetical protein